MRRLLVCALLLTGACTAPAPAVPAKDPCSLLTEVEVRAALPMLQDVSNGIATPKGDVRFCQWGPVRLGTGPFQRLIDETPEGPVSSSLLRVVDGIGRSAVASADNARVDIYVQTDRGGFALIVSAYEGVTIDRLMPLARLVASRL